MASARKKALWTILKGFFLAVLIALAGMLLLAAAVVLLGVPDGLLRALNQALKLIAVVLGVRFAVGMGGNRGFLTGLTVALLFMAVGYGCYAGLGGHVFSALAMLGEMLLGGAVGAISGAIFANMRPRSVRRRRSAA